MKGFTLLEVLIFGAISAFALYSVAQLLIKPTQMQRILTASETPREAAHAMDLLVNDLKEAAPGSVQWEVLTSTTPLIFAQSRLNPDTGIFEPFPLAYGYEGPEDGPGAFVRVEGSTRTVVLQPIDPPSVAAPLFQYDPALHVVMVDIRYHAADRPPLRLVRRVALSQ